MNAAGVFRPGFFIVKKRERIKVMKSGRAFYYSNEKELKPVRESIMSIRRDQNRCITAALMAAAEMYVISKRKSMNISFSRGIKEIYSDFGIETADVTVSLQLLCKIQKTTFICDSGFEIFWKTLVYGIRNAEKDKELRERLSLLIIRTCSDWKVERYKQAISSGLKGGKSANYTMCRVEDIAREAARNTNKIVFYLFLVCPELMDTQVVLGKSGPECILEYEKSISERFPKMGTSLYVIDDLLEIAAVEAGCYGGSAKDKNARIMGEYIPQDEVFASELEGGALYLLNNGGKNFRRKFHDFSLPEEDHCYSAIEFVQEQFFDDGQGISIIPLRNAKDGMKNLNMKKANEFMDSLSKQKSAAFDISSMNLTSDALMNKTINNDDEDGRGPAAGKAAVHEVMLYQFRIQSYIYGAKGYDIYHLICDRDFSKKDIKEMATLALMNADFYSRSSDGPLTNEQKWGAITEFVHLCCEEAIRYPADKAFDFLLKRKGERSAAKKKDPEGQTNKLRSRLCDLEKDVKRAEKEKSDAIAKTNSENRELRKEVHDLKGRCEELEKELEEARAAVDREARKDDWTEPGPDAGSEAVTETGDVTPDEDVIERFNMLNQDKKIAIWGARGSIERRIKEKCPDAILLSSDRDVPSYQMKNYDGLIILQGFTSHSAYWDVRDTAKRAGVPYRQLDKGTCNVEKIFKEALKIFEGQGVLEDQ